MKNLKFLVTEVSRIAFNDEKVMLENDSAKIIIHFKDQDDHGHVKKDDEVDFEDVMYGPGEASQEVEEEAEEESDDNFHDESQLDKSREIPQISSEAAAAPVKKTAPRKRR
jgi:hypothetical protein